MRSTSLTRFFAIILGASLLWGCSDNNNNNDSGAGGGDGPITVPETPVDPEFADYFLIELEPGDDLEQRALAAMIDAQPKTIIEFPAGYYEFDGELNVAADNVVIRGQGMDAESGTVLNFKNQTTGGQSILATGNNFVIEEIAVEDSPGDAIKVVGSNGVTIRKVRVEWTNGPDENNGAYGLYPVQTRNVLIEDSRVRGASDAGVYVGQSELIIVRRNYVWENVAGIEIENSKFADVYDNETTANTGGILVFDLPGPPIQGGKATRVFNNKIYDNNTVNFAPEGNIVGLVPTGTGLMILANDDIEAFNNEITGNISAGVVIVSYYINDTGVSKATYDPVPEKIYVHDNVIENNGTDPQMLAAAIKAFVFPGEGQNVDVFYDSSGVGIELGLLLEFPEGLTESQAICVVDNTPGITLGQANASVLLEFGAEDPAISTDADFFNCTHASLPEVVLEPPVDPDNPETPNNALELCSAEGEGINAAAFEADCPNLSDYRLFADKTDPTDNPNGRGVIYDLNTPLFTDYANKYRFVFVPEGTEAAYRSTEVFDFPVGTIITKTFTVQNDLRDENSVEDLIETRLLIRRADGWKALPYIWTADKSDAVLTPTGGTQPISWIDAQGQSRMTDYIIPNTNNCSNCHGEDVLLPIGPTARSLNRDFAYDSGTANQIEHWSAAGLLTGAPEDTSSIVTIPLWGDNTASLDDRARGYLDINCTHCHNPGGAGSTSGLYLEYSRPFGFDVGECKPPVAAGAGSGGLDHVIVPGDSDNSILTYRMDSNETDVRMPEIGRTVIHTEGVELIEAWINAMGAKDC
ncbi:MAG: right-handed parallel beta-helix repeat-containing protein [Gammaproteobacteria bacterium]|nr:right-handed parallel beta-helix repeat-containing protein [Gammaproteobacteria bacterium]